MPRLRTETLGTGDQSWLGSTHGIANARTETVDISAFTPATHYPNGYLPSGTAVNAANEGGVVPFTGAAGQQLGFILTDQTVVGTADFPAPVLRHGIINIGRLPGNFTVPTSGAAGFVFVGSDA